MLLSDGLKENIAIYSYNKLQTPITFSPTYV